MRAIRQFVIPVFTIGFVLSASADEPKKTPASDEAVASLIAQLGSPDFDKREEATRKLGEMPEALSALRRTAETEKQPEVAQRARSILPALTKRIGADKLKRLPFYTKHRQFDRMVELMVAWREAVSVEDRRYPRDLGEEVLQWAEREFGPGLPPLRVIGTPGAKYTPGGRRPPPGFGDWITETVGVDESGRGVCVKGDGLILLDAGSSLLYTDGDPGLTHYEGPVFLAGP